MEPEVYVGTLIGPRGQTVGCWVRYEAYHNLLQAFKRAADNLEPGSNVTQEFIDELRAAVPQSEEQK